MFMLILWLQGIWLPLHGYSFADTPLWAGIYMLPLSAGFLVAGPVSGRLADRFGARPFATGGHDHSAIGFLLLVALPVDFTYWELALVIFLIGVAMGLFAAPNLTGIMNSLPPDQRGRAPAWQRPSRTPRRAVDRGVLQPDHCRPVSTLPAVLLPRARVARRAPGGRDHGLAAPAGGQPVRRRSSATTRSARCSAPTLPHLPHATAAYLTGHKFFPTLVSHPFATGIHTVFYFAAGCCVVAAIASWLRGGKYYYKADVAEVEEAELLEVA